MRNSSPTVSKDEQFLSFPNCDLGKQREQIIGHALGVFAHDSAWVRASRVEVS